MTTRLTRSTTVLAALAAGLLVVSAGACGSDDASDSGADDPASPVTEEPVDDDQVVDPSMGACIVDDPDCVETGAENAPPLDDPDAGAIDEAAIVEGARGLLGTPEDELSPDVRIGRRGDELMALTADYVIGRMTAELDEVDGVFVVTSVTIELTDSTVTVDETDG